LVVSGRINLAKVYSYSTVRRNFAAVHLLSSAVPL
jgi:hypothetical protein